MGSNGFLGRSAHSFALSVAASLAAATICIALPGPAAAQTMPQGSLDDLPSVEQVELTEDSARNAIYAYRDLKERYGDEMPETNDSTSWTQSMSTRADVISTVSSYGFNDPYEWYRTLSSFIIAYLMGVEGHGADMEEAIAQIEANDQLPESMKEQLLARFQLYLPSEGNVAVAQSLSSDAEITAMIHQFRE